MSGCSRRSVCLFDENAVQWEVGGSVAGWAGRAGFVVCTGRGQWKVGQACGVGDGVPVARLMTAHRVTSPAEFSPRPVP